MRGDLQLRKCYKCGEPIEACMGFVLARDFLARISGDQRPVREICGKCVLLYERRALPGNY